MNIILHHSDHRLYPSARSLELLQSDQSHDMYDIDVYYHQSCYITFALNPLFEEDKRNCLKEQQK